MQRRARFVICSSQPPAGRAFEQRRGRIPPDYEGCSQTIAPAPGTRCTEERVSQTWAHPSPFSDGFRRMIDNPLVNERL